MKIKKVSLKKFQKLLNDDFAVGRYYTKQGEKYIGGYFSHCILDADIRSFDSKEECMEWLKSKGCEKK